MGNIRTRNIKDAAFELYETYPEKFNDDFENNKKALEELKIAENKKQRNIIAGYVVRVARLQKRKE